MKMYHICEIFESLQGEGLHTGMAALFVRFSGCNLRCSFCDTDFFERESLTLDALVARVAESKVKSVILTGGEPAMQVDAALVEALHGIGKTVHVETNGTLPLPETIDWVTCSPKTTDISRLKIARVDELKVVYEAQDMTAYDAMIARFRPQSLRLQPCDTGNRDKNALLTREAVEYVLNHPEWRLSLQTHKLINIQ